MSLDAAAVTGQTPVAAMVFGRAPVRVPSPELWTIGADGRGARLLVDHALGPSWSPDSRSIASGQQTAAGWRLTTINADGTGVHAVTTPTATAIEETAWSPDGERIAYVVSAPRFICGDVHVVGADGSGDVDLTRRTTLDSSPGWAPDGARLALVRRPNGGGVPRIVTVLPDGSDERMLRALPAGTLSVRPAWSSRNELTFSAAYDRRGAVYLLDVARRTERRLTSGTKPAWSADGRQLVLVDRREGDADLFVIRPDGRGRRLLTRDFADELDPDW